MVLIDFKATPGTNKKKNIHRFFLKFFLQTNFTIGIQSIIILHLVWRTKA